jgi:hypothetical protein
MGASKRPPTAGKSFVGSMKAMIELLNTKVLPCSGVSRAVTLFVLATVFGNIGLLVCHVHFLTLRMFATDSFVCTVYQAQPQEGPEDD